MFTSQDRIAGGGPTDLDMVSGVFLPDEVSSTALGNRIKDRSI